MTDAPNPMALAAAVNRDTLDGEGTMVRSNAKQAGGEELYDAQEAVGRAR